MNTVWIFVVTFLCFSQVFSIGFGIPLGEENSGYAPNHEVQNVENNLNMLRLYNEQNVNSSCPMNIYTNGIYTIKVLDLEPFQVLCSADIAGPGWIVIASRSNADLNFMRSWKDYKNGFGNITGDFFIGLDKLHAITDSRPHELFIQLEDFDGEKRYATYDEFHIGNETKKYIMSTLGTYQGNMGDSLSYNKGRQFTTVDRDNGPWNGGNCAIESLGAWWYGACSNTNLFGLYLNGTNSDDMVGKVMSWNHWRGNKYSYKEMRMMVKPKCSC